jgi:hypothetical protein
LNIIILLPIGVLQDCSIIVAYCFNGFICTGCARVARSITSLVSGGDLRAARVITTCSMKLIILQSTAMLRIQLLTTLIHFFIGFI